ncbi:unnamed protein product [Moneuplotes crassus]|uniref:Uncharacterized protein n=2 Tax=Euplotes crassus TaxID=5936 RepID=A0AAD1XAK1_EUPCR|nr:unnamed protein product [Moneuplotes crassus]
MGNLQINKNKSKRKSKNKKKSKKSKLREIKTARPRASSKRTKRNKEANETLSKRSDYYNMLGIQSARRNTLSRTNSLPRISLRAAMGNMNESQDSLNLGSPKQHKYHNDSVENSGVFIPKRSPSSDRLMRFNSLAIHKTDENSKENIGRLNTVSTTFDKFVCDQQDEKNNEDDEVFDSFMIPEVEDFQMDYRNKILQNVSTDPDSMRQKYLNKLAQKKVWLVPREKPKAHQTITIFDWDDTILCTSYLNPNGYATNDPVPINVKPTLKKLETIAIELLLKAVEHGDVYIITNAAHGWVEFSSEKYLPKVYEILDKVTVVSARTKYECLLPGKTCQWKMHAFLDTTKKMEKHAVTNIIAIGDSNIEMEASKVLARKFPRALLKTVKLREEPSPDELVKQLVLVSNRMPNILTTVKNLTIRLERKEDS